MKKIKEKFAKKNLKLRQIEKEVGKGIVKIGENAPEQLLKKEKKPRHKPQERKVQREKPSKMLKSKVPQEREEYRGMQEIKLDFGNNGLLKRCPECNSRLKKTWVKQIGTIIRQGFKCKKCKFEKELSFTI
jgi:hypothetical protein